MNTTPTQSLQQWHMHSTPTHNFFYGQLYVAISKIGNPERLHFLSKRSKKGKQIHHNLCHLFNDSFTVKIFVILDFVSWKHVGQK